MPKPEAIIAGVGQTAFSAASGEAERALAIEAIAAALEDAGLTTADVDGLSTFDIDPNDPLLLARDLALGPLTWFSRTSYGGGQACAPVQDAALAVAAGVANVVVVYRAANMRSGARYGQGQGGDAHTQRYFEAPARVGLVPPGHIGALWFHRYLRARGLDPSALADVVLTSRRYARTNPRARFYENSFTREDYFASPWAAEPVLRVADCCLETDGGVALVITRLGHTRATRAPVAVTAAARGMSRASSILQHYSVRDGTALPDLEIVLAQLWRLSGLSARHLSAAIIYDAFSPLVLMALESLGIAKGPDAAAFIAGGGAGLAGDLPINPNGGQLSEAYIHGFNGMAEAVRQLRGEAANQVANAEHILVTGGPALPTSGLILSATS